MRKSGLRLNEPLTLKLAVRLRDVVRLKYFGQGSLTVEEGSVQLTTLCKLV
jgi:hypothetical protein